MRGPDPRRTSLARTLRRTQPAAEQRLWRSIRNRQLSGLKFVRQVPVGPYVADFLCREQRLIVEVDGATHSTDEELAHDARRDADLRAAGYRVLRFQNSDVYDSLDAVCEAILAAAAEPPRPSSYPSPRRRGEGTGIRAASAPFSLSPLAGRGSG